MDWAIGELEALLADRAEDPRAREALDTLRRAWVHARAGAHTDPLTELPNRAWFQQALDATLARCGRAQTGAALLFLDLDGFKDVNDARGHQAGDLLLSAVAKRVLASVREEDLVARHGGDEFVVLLANLEGPQVAHAIAARIVEAVSTNYAVEGTPFRLSVSVGVALYPQHGTNGAELLRHADVAMYRAKHRGGRGYEVFDPTLSPESLSGRRERDPDSTCGSAPEAED